MGRKAWHIEHWVRVCVIHVFLSKRHPCDRVSLHPGHGSYTKLKPFFKDFSRTLHGMSCYLFNTMNHSVWTKLAPIYIVWLNCTFQAFCCKTNTNTTLQLRNVKPAPCGMKEHFNSYTQPLINLVSAHILARVQLCLFYTILCSFSFCVSFTKLKRKNTLIFTMQLCCNASDSMLAKIQGLFKIV